MKPLTFALALLAAPVAAQDTDASDAASSDAFVEANILAIFYHELGHALIDVLDLPVFGQEEDAADTASILLIDATFDEETAVEIATDAALGFYAEAEQTGNDVAWWDEHGADLQRYYNLVCLFYGANPDDRDGFAEDMGLPEERAETCPDEYDLAIRSWGPVFDGLLEDNDTGKLVYTGGDKSLTERVIGDEVASLNAEISLPVAVEVTVESCNEPNAFYNSEDRKITMCSEFAPYLKTLASDL